MSTKNDRPAIILSSVPDAESGNRIAQQLIEKKLAACVKVLSACSSTYTWQGKTVCEKELPVMIATTAARAEAALEALIDLHPYEVPEAVILPATGASAAYLDWLADCVAAPR